MAIQNGRAERAPLIHRSTSVRAIYQPDDEEEKGISTARGSVIISSIGLLIFLQGRSFLLSFRLCAVVVVSVLVHLLLSLFVRRLDRNAAREKEAEITLVER
jgi:Na+/proline symporter